MSLPVLAIVVSVAALLVTVVNVLVTHTRNYWNEARTATREALKSFLAPEVIRARDVVVSAAQEKPLMRAGIVVTDRGQKRQNSADALRRIAEVRASCFTLMWTIQAVEPTAGRYIKGKNIATPEAITLYWHIGAVSHDLAAALKQWGGLFEWKEVGDRTNQVLENLPVVQNGFWKQLAQRPETRLPVPSDPDSPAARDDAPAGGADK